METNYLLAYKSRTFDLSYEACGYFDNRPHINLALWWKLVFILPFRNKWTDECIPPKWGIAIHGNTFWIYRGGKGNMNGGNKWWTWDIPFFTKQWVRTSILLKGGTWEHSTKGDHKEFYEEEWKSKQKMWYYDYTDSYDGTVVGAKIYVEEREWRPKWLTWTNKFAKVRRTIDIDFDKEVGSRKGSWKGGVVGCGYDLLPEEDPIDCIKRMEKERKFK